MSEPVPEPGAEGGGGFFSQKLLGIPVVFWLAAAAIVAYLYFRNQSGGAASSTGGGGTSQTGNIQVQPGTETIQVQGGDNEGGGGPPPRHRTHNPQPKPRHRPPVKTHTGNKRTYIVEKGDTLESVARKYGISVEELAHANVYVPGEVPGNAKVGQRLGTGAGLKTGQKLVIP